jgi:disulfide bond formation protein DsbB
MKQRNLIGFLLSMGLIAAALFLQAWKHLNPCPLCIMQRIAFMSIAVLFLIFLCLPTRYWLNKIHAVLLLIAAGSGLAIALRQVYLQHLPADKVPGCGPGLNYLVQNFPLHQVAAMVLQGSGECAIVDWQFLGLSMAGWSALWLAFFCLWAIKQLFEKNL